MKRRRYSCHTLREEVLASPHYLPGINMEIISCIAVLNTEDIGYASIPKRTYKNEAVSSIATVYLPIATTTDNRVNI